MKIIKQISWLICLYCWCPSLNAQTQSIWEEQPNFSISGFADVFYAYDFDQPEVSVRQPFFFNHNRHNEFNLNLGLITFGLDHTKYRANLALQTGTYANDNYAAEPGLLKNIFEASIGVSLNENNNLWLDAGVLPSPIGFESAISMDNPTLTRSLLAENSPYFLTGAKLTFTPSEQWELAAYITNGWQRIQRVQGNSLPSFSTQINYSPSDNVTLNWSTFIGTDDPDDARRMRYFSDIYGQFQLSDKFALTAGFDIGTQQQSKESSDFDTWLSPIVIGELMLNDRWKMGIRAEYYQDEAGVIIPTNTRNGFQTTAYSLNFDYAPTQNLMWRIEGRLLNSEDDIFINEGTATNANFFISSSIAVKFGRIDSERGR